MLDLSKTYCKNLNIYISTAVITPNEYRFETKTYDTYYILSSVNPFVTLKKAQEVSNEKGIALVAIFPSLDIKKNQLLFESFKSDYLYSMYYQEEIMVNIIPALEKRYRFNQNYANKHIIGFDNLSLMALTISLDYPSHFYHVYSIGLDYSIFKAEFIAYFKSKLDQRVEYLIKSNSYNELKEIANLFGIASFKEININTLDELITLL